MNTNLCEKDTSKNINFHSQSMAKAHYLSIAFTVYAQAHYPSIAFTVNG